MKRRLSRRSSGGFTLIEMVMAVGIGSLVVAALFFFVAQFYRYPRREYEQGKITEDAKKNLDRVSDLIRQAVDVDWNQNGRIDSGSTQEKWLQLGDDDEIIFYVLVGDVGSEQLQKVRIWLNGNKLKQETSTISSGACFGSPVSKTTSRSLQNVGDGTVLFKYLTNLGAVLVTPVVNVDSVDQVRLEMVIDSDLQQEPGAVRIQTEITPRRGAYWFVSGGGVECSDCIDNDLDGTVDTGGVSGMEADPGCSGAGDASERGSIECDNEVDDDGQGDGQAYVISGQGDPQCAGPADAWEGPRVAGSGGPAPTPTCVATEIVGVAQCADGIDNDCDTYIDYSGGLGDQGCRNDGDNNEWSQQQQCNDGLDNDEDGTYDYTSRNPVNPDADCAAAGDKSEFQSGMQ